MGRDYLLVGVCYSDNLGDGVIADCLEFAIKVAYPEAKVARLDVAGRQGFHVGKLKGKATLLRVLDSIPEFWQPLITAPAILALLLKGPIWRWRRQITRDTRVVIGGGQLLSHVNLNFPVKLALVSLLARLARAKTAIFAVGVSSGWGRSAKALLGAVVSHASRVFIGVRDAKSVSRLAGHLGMSESSIHLTPDPGVLAAEVYGRPHKATGAIGINLADPVGLKGHVEGTQGSFSKERHLAIWQDVLRGLLDDGHRVCFFTNGAQEDQAFLDEFRGSLGEVAAHKNVAFLPQARDPRELAHQIANVDLIVAHRLHAHIVAFSYLIPAVALGWDDKLDAFFRAIGEQEAVLRPADFAAPEILRRISGSRTQKRSAEALRRISRDVLGAVASLTRAFEGK